MTHRAGAMHSCGAIMHRFGVMAARLEESRTEDRTRKRRPSAVGAQRSVVGRQQAARLGRAERASIAVGGSPVRSVNQWLGTPSASRIAFSMNSNGSSSARDLGRLREELAASTRAAGSSPAGDSASGARCDAGTRSWSARRRRCRGSRRSPSSSGCAGTRGRAARRPRFRSARSRRRRCAPRSSSCIAAAASSSGSGGG